jgi:hypothetical protein
MEADFFAQIDIGDIGQILIVVLILAASAWKKVAEVLIRKFSPPPKEEADRLREQREKMMRRPPPPGRPVARPMPTRVERRTIVVETPQEKLGTPQPPTSSLPGPLREILSEILPEVVPPPPKPARPVRRTEGAGPGERKRPDRPPASRVEGVGPARPAPPRTPPTRRSAQAAPPRKPGAKPTNLAPETTESESPYVDVSTHVEGHIGHLESEIERRPAAEIEPAAGRRSSEIMDVVQLRDRNHLRRAVILSEILSPPLAIRSSEIGGGVF